MAWGKEKFRSMYKTSSESLQIISNNYYELDHDYQMLGKALLEIKEIVKKSKNNNYEGIGNDTNKIVEIIDKALDLESEVK